MRLRSSAWAVPIVAAVQMDPVSTQSAISVGLMVTISGAVAWLSRALTRSEERLRSLDEKLLILSTVPERMTKIEARVEHIATHVGSLEDDINNLWSEWRKEPGNELDNIRRERGPRPRRDL